MLQLRRTTSWFALPAVLLALASGACRGPDPATKQAADALSVGDLARARSLYEAGADVDAGFDDGYTALMMTSASGATDAVRLLLELGADPDVRSVGGETALIVAARRRRPEIVAMLLAAGADPSLRNRSGESAESIARRAGYGEIVAALSGG